MCEKLKPRQFQCKKVYDPVCGSDGVNYNSECELRAKNCGKNDNVVVHYKGPCVASKGDVGEPK